MKSGEVNVLKLTAPTDVAYESGDGWIRCSGRYAVQFWLVPDAKTVDEATQRVTAQIVSEFKDFKPQSEVDLTVNGAPAKQLIGTGFEADDNDPGHASVVVFKVGKHIFIACNHGEDPNPAGLQGIMALLQTAKIP